jgi:hypothetical protein
LQQNPRGLLLANDELSGWLGSFDRYSKGRAGGGDRAQWLKVFDADTLIIDRKSATPPTIYIRHAAVSVTGTIQPRILRQQLTSEHRDSGLAARLLMACPPRRAKVWTDDDVDPTVQAAVAKVVDRLLALELAVDENGKGHPVVVHMEPAARQRFIAYYNEHNAEQVGLHGDLSAAWSKLEGYAPRLALVIHLVRWAAGVETIPDACLLDVESMEAGVSLCEWFKHEAKRVYAMLDESDDDHNTRRLVEWIERNGGSARARDVQMGCRWLREPGEAEAALEQLAKAGWGCWESTPAGQRGQPTRHFRLSTPSTVNSNPVFPGVNCNTVDVDTVDAPESQADGEWGEL